MMEKFFNKTTVKKFLVTDICLASAAIALWFPTASKIVAANQKSETVYPWAAVVVSVDENADTVSVATGSGLVYEFFGTEDWEVGDIAALLMNDNGTPDSVLDDEIISARYAGYPELFDFQVLEVVEHEFE